MFFFHRDPSQKIQNKQHVCLEAQMPLVGENDSPQPTRWRELKADFNEEAKRIRQARPKKKITIKGREPSGTVKCTG
jgi:hypothetical protein